MRFNDIKFRVLTAAWPLGNVGKRMAKIGFIDRHLGPLFWNEESVDATYIPVGEDLEVPPGSVLPLQIIAELVEEASNRVVLSMCICRTSLKCRAHPRDLGCLFLGDAAGQIDPRYCRPVTVDEAMAHVESARDSGLLPCVLHAQFDATLLGIEYRKMLAVCFCCDCCCVFRKDMRGGPWSYSDRIIRLPGLKMVSGGECDRCGLCLDSCFLGALSLGPEGPVFADYCKGCGRCAYVCPRGTIYLDFEGGVDSRAALLERLSARTDIT